MFLGIICRREQSKFVCSFFKTAESFFFTFIADFVGTIKQGSNKTLEADP